MSDTTPAEERKPYEPTMECPECSDKPCHNPEHLANTATYWWRVSEEWHERNEAAASRVERLEEALWEIEPHCRYFADYAVALIPSLVGQGRLQWQEREQQFRRLSEIAQSALSENSTSREGEQ